MWTLPNKPQRLTQTRTKQVVQQYLRECFRFDSIYQNAKYTVMEMLTKRRHPDHLKVTPSFGFVFLCAPSAMTIGRSSFSADEMFLHHMNRHSLSRRLFSTLPLRYTGTKLPFLRSDARHTRHFPKKLLPYAMCRENAMHAFLLSTCHNQESICLGLPQGAPGMREVTPVKNLEQLAKVWDVEADFHAEVARCVKERGVRDTLADVTARWLSHLRNPRVLSRGLERIHRTKYRALSLWRSRDCRNMAQVFVIGVCLGAMKSAASCSMSLGSRCHATRLAHMSLPQS